MQGLHIARLPDGRNALIMRTSDRLAFKQCRRKWGWSSHLKANLAPKALAAPLWFGSAIHYALEDFHGYNYFGRASSSFKAYCIATAKNWKRELPGDAQEHYHMGIAMMDYYQDMWLGAYPRKADETYWAPNPTTGVLEPQVEVNFEIPLDISGNPLLVRYAAEHGIDVVLYRGTMDRVSIDQWGHLWVVEYKTAKVIQSTHFQTDPQVSTYCWAAGLIYDKPVAGVVYHQFLKKTPKGPNILSSGKISTAQNQGTSYVLYKQTLEQLFGSVQQAPSANQAYMELLMKSEGTDRDRYVVREPIERNPAQCLHEHWKIMMELEDYMNPELPLYPNPTRDCARMCSFVTPCVNMDDGSDWEALLEASFSPRDNDLDRMWRMRLPEPKVLWDMEDHEVEPDLDGIQQQSLEDAKAAQIAIGDYPPAEWEIAAYDSQGYKDPFRGMKEDGSFNMAEVERNN